MNYTAQQVKDLGLPGNPRTLLLAGLQSKLVYPPHPITPRAFPWQYVRWISNPPATDCGSFEQLCAKAIRSDHGETRELDMYPWGAVVWYRENK